MSYATSLDALLSASPTGDFLSVFSTFSVSDNTSVYNTNLWGGGGHSLDWTGILWDENHVGGNIFGNAVAITKRHLLTSEHGGTISGVPLTWIKSDGTLVNRTAKDAVTYVGGTLDTEAMRVLYLDSDLPAGIAIYPIAAILAGSYLGVPLVKFTNANKASICNCTQFDEIFTVVTPGIFAGPTDPVRAQYFLPTTGGDSGSPAFFVDGTQLLYAGTVTEGGGEGDQNQADGPTAGSRVEAILDACATLDARNDNTGYVPSFFSSFTPSKSGCSLGIGIGI